MFYSITITVEHARTYLAKKRNSGKEKRYNLNTKRNIGKQKTAQKYVIH